MPESSHPSGGVRAVASHLSIGEVLGMLLEEFPDVTISKIRFLESQGLIEPERTPSGYRKFYGDDVDLLRLILREQRENFLPLRVIKDRIDSGEINAGDPPAEAPRGVRNVSVASPTSDDSDLLPGLDTPASAAGPAAPDAAASAPAANGVDGVDEVDAEVDVETDNEVPEVAEVDKVDKVVDGAAASDAIDVDRSEDADVDERDESMITAAELATEVGTTPARVEELCSFGLIAASDHLGEPMFDEDAVAVARICAKFMDIGIDARHLRGWRTSADRELSLYEALTLPLLRQRNPQARRAARQRLVELNELGTALRSALVDLALRQHLTP